MKEEMVKFNNHEDYCAHLKKEGIRFGPFYECEQPDNVLTRNSNKEDRPDKVWKNNIYQVSVFNAERFPDSDWPEMWHLSVKRIDREPFHDWRDMQTIKNCICGPDHEGVELFPMERRLVDSANQYHLFVLKDKGVPFPFGFTSRMVDDGQACGTKQKPWATNERPEDCTRMTDEELIAEAKRQDSK